MISGLSEAAAVSPVTVQKRTFSIGGLAVVTTLFFISDTIAPVFTVTCIFPFTFAIVDTALQQVYREHLGDFVY